MFQRLMRRPTASPGRSPQTRSRLKMFPALMLAAITLVGSFEGLRTAAYIDPVGIPTICFGETKGVKMGDRATRAECEAMLAERLVEFEMGVRAVLTKPVNDNQLMAFTSLAYNIGPNAFASSSVVRRFNAGNAASACDAILMWNKGTVRGVKVVLPGLVKRRKEERALCLKPANDNPQTYAREAA